MAIKLKTKIKPKIAVDEQTEVALDQKKRIKKKAAEYIRLQKQLEDVGLTIGKKAAKLALELKTYADQNRKDTETLHIKTKEGRLKITDKGLSTEITKPKRLKKLLGKETFDKLAKVGVGDARRYLTPEEFEEISKTTRSGARRIVIE